MIICLLLAIWYLLGTIPVILMWRTQRDVTGADLALILSVGLLGPISTASFWIIAMPKSDKIIIPKRRP